MSLHGMSLPEQVEIKFASDSSMRIGFPGALMDGSEAALYDLVSSVNVARGGHAGDAESMLRSVGLATERGPRIGAHPSYPAGRALAAVASNRVLVAVHAETICVHGDSPKVFRVAKAVRESLIAAGFRI